MRSKCCRPVSSYSLSKLDSETTAMMALYYAEFGPCCDIKVQEIHGSDRTEAMSLDTYFNWPLFISRQTRFVSSVMILCAFSLRNRDENNYVR